MIVNEKPPIGHFMQNPTPPWFVDLSKLLSRFIQTDKQASAQSGARNKLPLLFLAVGDYLFYLRRVWCEALSQLCMVFVLLNFEFNGLDEFGDLMALTISGWRSGTEKRLIWDLKRLTHGTGAEFSTKCQQESKELDVWESSRCQLMLVH